MQITLANTDKLGHSHPNGKILDLVPLSLHVMLDVTPVASPLPGGVLPPLPSNLDQHVVRYIHHVVLPVGMEVRDAGGHKVQEVL